MRKISQVIKKNYKVLLRNKFSLFILLIGPIILTFLIGFFYFNSNSFSINLGITSPDDSEFNNFFISELENSDFSIFKYNTQLNCENAIKSGIIHACIYLPKDFSINDSSNNNIILKLDTSRGDIVAVTENLINDQIVKISTKVQIQNTQSLLDIINESENLINYTDKQIIIINQITSDLKKSNTDIKTKTNEISTLFDTEVLGIDQLTSRYGGLNSSIHSLVEAGLSAHNISENSLIESLILLDDLNSSDSKVSDTETLLKTSKTQIGVMESKFNSVKNSYYLRELGKIVGNVENNLGSAEKDSGDISGDISFSLTDNSKLLDNTSEILINIGERGENFKSQVSKLDSKNAQTLMTPISIDTQNVVANSSIHLVSIFPSLIVGLIFIISLIMSSMFILTERKNKAHFRNFMSKNSAFNFLLGDFISLSSIVFLQAGLIITLYHFWFLKSTDFIQFTTLLLMILPIISVFVLIGMLVGYLTKSESSNVILTFLVILSFLTLSGKILPIEALSNSVAQIAIKNPFLLGEGMIRKYLLFGVEINQMKSELILILSYSGIFLLLNFILESFSKKRFIYGVYSQITLSIRNYFIKPTSQATSSSTLKKPFRKSNQTNSGQEKDTQTNMNTTPVGIPISTQNIKEKDFELESVSNINKEIKKL